MLSAYRAQPLIRPYLDHPFSLPWARSTTSADTDALTVDIWWLVVGGWRLEGGNNAVHPSCDPGSCPHNPP